MLELEGWLFFVDFLEEGGIFGVVFGEVADEVSGHLIFD